MKLAADFRALAREALAGRWRVAVLTGFVASLIGAEIAGGGGSSSGNSDDSSITLNLQEIVDVELWLRIRHIVVLLGAVLVIWLFITLFIGGAGKLGYAKFNLNLVDHKYADFHDLFSQFHRWTTGFCMNFLMGLYTIFWTFLFIIPGIIKAYSYAMTPYILAEYPEMTANEAITTSRRIMDGNKWRLFCLGISFIGWDLLCALPAIISVSIMTVIATRTENVAMLIAAVPVGILMSAGILFLRPYQEAAYAAFYRDVSGAAQENDPLQLPDFGWHMDH